MKTLAVEGWSLLPALAVPVGLLFAAGFVLRQRTAAAPLLDLGLFRIRAFSGAITVNAVAMFAMMGFTLFTSQYLQLVKGMSPLTASLWSLVPSVGVGAAVGVSSALAGKVRPAALMAGGFLTGAAGFAMMTLVGADSPLALILTAAGVLAAGTVGTMTLTAEMVVSAAPVERAGAASATSETAVELGSSLGIALLGAAGAAVYRSASTARSRPVWTARPPAPPRTPSPARSPSPPGCPAGPAANCSTPPASPSPTACTSPRSSAWSSHSARPCSPTA